jgi:asparagine synthase (glutamine-hydrolysing)
MCGVVGIIDLKTGTVSKRQLKRMADVLIHRGPDGEGYLCDGPVGFGHRRLSIIDLAGGKQPMRNDENSIWITFNGEIYNFLEIRSELQSRGHSFKTKSDTEVLLRAYQEFGEDCLQYLRGMFAFGIWDARRRHLFLARDRIGKKPLYYYYDDRIFVFGSEIKAILQYPLVPKEIDPSALMDYFTYQYIPFPKSIFKNIYKLSMTGSDIRIFVSVRIFVFVMQKTESFRSRFLIFTIK